MKKFLKNLVTFTALAASGLHVVNLMIEDNATRKNILTKKDGHYFHWKQGDIYYTKEGSGPNILLVHNLSPEGSGYEWSKIKHLLARTNTVYTIDLLGCGRSSKPGITYTNYLYVGLIRDFINKIIGSETTVISSGLSSTFSIMSVFEEESSINKLILINPTELKNVNKLVNEHCPIYKKIFNVPILGTYIFNILMRRSYIKSKCNEKYCTKYYYVTPDMIDAYYESCHLDKCNGKYLYSSIQNNYLNASINNALKNVDKQIYIIESEAEANKTNSLKEYMEVNSEIIGTIIKGTKGMPHVENARRTFDTIQTYLE